MKSSILIKNAQLDMQPMDIFIEGNIIKKIGKDLDVQAVETIDASGKAVIRNGKWSYTRSHDSVPWICGRYETDAVVGREDLAE